MKKLTFLLLISMVIGFAGCGEADKEDILKDCKADADSLKIGQLKKQVEYYNKLIAEKKAQWWDVSKKMLKDNDISLKQEAGNLSAAVDMYKERMEIYYNQWVAKTLSNLTFSANAPKMTVLKLHEKMLECQNGLEDNAVKKAKAEKKIAEIKKDSKKSPVDQEVLKDEILELAREDDLLKKKLVIFNEAMPKKIEKLQANTVKLDAKALDKTIKELKDKITQQAENIRKLKQQQVNAIHMIKAIKDLEAIYSDELNKKKKEVETQPADTGK